MGAYWGRQAYLKAKSLVGKTYVWGSEGPEGDDCSGLTQWSYAQEGIWIPRTTFNQYTVCPVTGPYFNGDLLFFMGSDPQGGKPGHVGFFAGYGVITSDQHNWSGSGKPTKVGKCIVLNAPYTGDPGGIRFDYADNIGEVVAHTRPGNLKKDPLIQRILKG